MSDWTAKDRAIASLKEAIKILEGEGPSLLEQLGFGPEDDPHWRISSAQQYIDQALRDLSER